MLTYPVLRLNPVEPGVQTRQTLLGVLSPHVVVGAVPGGGGLPHAVGDAGDHLGEASLSPRHRSQG